MPIVRGEMQVIRLQILGGVGLEGPERPELQHLLTQPKPLALLCVMALAGGTGFSRRDTLVSLFWPDLDHDHARAALRQTILVLRRCLGGETIVGRGDDEIGLDPARIWCDATAFQQSCDAGDAAGAMRLYRGHLLEGMHLPVDTPDLAQWLDAERFRLRRLAQEMAWECMEQSQEEGNLPEACRLARRAVEIEPFDEQGVRRFLRLLDQAGDRAGAVREYESFAARLSEELEVRPSAETEALIAAIRARVPSPGPSLQATEERTATQAGYPPTAIAGPGSRSRLRALWLLVPAAIAGLVLAFKLAPPLRHRDPIALEPDVIALMPWRVSGADPGLAWLREGMIDLLHATLTGDRGPRAADPRTVLQALGASEADPTADVPLQTAIQTARRIGAGRVIQGGVVGTPAHLTITATEFTTANPRPQLAFSVSGSVDSLPWMIERLTALVLAHETSDPEHIQSLSTTSLPALRIYLEGREAYRRGLYTEAARDFDQALDIDSSFALAAVGLATGSLTLSNNDLMEKGQRIAWRESSRLSPRDRALVEDLVGPHYPAPSDEREYLASRERAVALAPESPEAWYWLGDSFFHYGRLLALSDWQSRAIAAFERSIRLDSAYAAPYEHLIEARLQAGDTVDVRRLGSIYVALDSTGEYGDYVRWRVALALGDSSGLAALRARFNRMSIESLYRIATDAQFEGIGLDDADRAAGGLEAQASDYSSRLYAAYTIQALRANEGRPLASLAATGAMAADSGRPLADRWLQVADAIYGDGDTVAATRAVHGMISLADGNLLTGPGAAVTQQIARCTVALWRLRHHETRGISLAIRQLRQSSMPEESGFDVWMTACATILDAQLSAELSTADTTSALNRLDSLVSAGAMSPLWVPSLLVLAELKQRRGNLQAALATVRRRENNYNPRYLSSQLLVQARIAALVGPKPEAIDAYRHYLALRFAPEPSLRPKVEAVRRELAALLAGTKS
jgi:DNA-binding SARP family transcriptional activator/tetratricopeptide (TPR) repeat protein